MQSILLTGLFGGVLVNCSGTPERQWIVTKDRSAESAEPGDLTSEVDVTEPQMQTLSVPPAPVPVSKKLTAAPSVSSAPSPVIPQDLSENCYSDLKDLPGVRKNSEVYAACQKVQMLQDCFSEKGRPIYHYDRQSENPNQAKRILTIALIHGDELTSGSVARSWITRLESLDPRNSWRVIPIANPDGWQLKTRTNARKVDLNRNFPTEDWQELALRYWREKKKADPRRYPGPHPASEKETQCLMSHFKDFNPHFIISVHTPLGMLDFDGPKQLKFPLFSPLPWISLGNFPGSLGRYMWVDQSVPVLTIELKGTEGVKQLERFDQLQDVSGTVAIQSIKLMEKFGQRKPQKANGDDEK